MSLIILDIALCVGLVILALAALSVENIFRSVVLFIAFGLLVALVWARLRAPDVALAEAAIGAGLSGALLISAVGRAASPARAPAQITRNVLLTVFSLIVSAGLIWILVDLARSGLAEGLAGKVAAAVDRSGVSNPVTAVLLNFRNYDTLLELAVLMAAAFGIAALAGEREPQYSDSPVFASLTQWLIPVLILIAGYLLWVGAHAPGGAFQAGAMLAAAGVIARLSGTNSAGLPPDWIMRLASVLGVSVFALVGTAMLALGGEFLQFPPASAGSLILLIETAATLSIATLLIMAYLGGCPRQWYTPRSWRSDHKASES